MSDAAVVEVLKTDDGGWRIADSRVSLDSVVYSFCEGMSAEEIADEFPSLTLRQIHGALAFYLRNQREIDSYLAQQDAKWHQFAAQSKLQHGDLLDRLRKNRESDSED